MIKALVTDIDGVLTTGHKAFDLNGNVISKTFFDRDFLYINKLVSSDISIVFCSADDRVNKVIANKRAIPFLYAIGPYEKTKAVSEWLNEQDLLWEEIICIGDSISDLDLLLAVSNNGGLALAPADSSLVVKQSVDVVLDTSGGHGVIEEVYQKYFGFL